jgi:hypothetical protein
MNEEKEFCEGERDTLALRISLGQWGPWWSEEGNVFGIFFEKRWIATKLHQLFNPLRSCKLHNTWTNTRSNSRCYLLSI